MKKLTQKQVLEAIVQWGQHSRYCPSCERGLSLIDLCGEGQDLARRALSALTSEADRACGPRS